jgi:hypothetical protein
MILPPFESGMCVQCTRRITRLDRQCVQGTQSMVILQELIGLSNACLERGSFSEGIAKRRV